MKIRLTDPLGEVYATVDAPLDPKQGIVYVGNQAALTAQQAYTLGCALRRAATYIHGIGAALDVDAARADVERGRE